MNNEVAAQRGTGGLSFTAPAHLQQQMAEAGAGNIREGFSVNQLTFAGKEWTITVNSERKVLQRVNEDGDVEKLQTLRVVVLDQGVRGRNFYENWDPSNPRAPDCWSEDGKRPHSSVAEPRHLHCDGCPMSIKGSRQSDDGTDTVACKSFKYLAVLPVKGNTIAYDFPPLRLKLAPSSIWDERRPDDVAQGWYAWDNFTKYLRSNGVSYTNAMVVRMRFASTNHPQIQFARGDFLEVADFQKTLALAQTEDVQKLVSYIAMGSPAPKGKALPKDAPADPVFSQTNHVAQAAQKAENERLKAEVTQAKLREQAEAVEAARKAQIKIDEEAATRLKAAEARAAEKAAAAAAAAEAARLAAEAEAGEAAPPTAPTAPADEGWDEPTTVPKAVAAPAKPDTPPPAKKAEPKQPPAAPASAPAEVPPSLTGILADWD